MKKKMLPALLAAALLLSGLGGNAAQAQANAEGLWRNPRGSVVVRIGDCRGRLCGWIVWANAEAKADARDSGIDRLIGIELLEDYVPRGPGQWAGLVYVPDMGHRFSSTIFQIDANAMKVQGCLIGSFFCRSQIRRRIEKLPDA